MCRSRKHGLMYEIIKYKLNNNKTIEGLGAKTMHIHIFHFFFNAFLAVDTMANSIGAGTRHKRNSRPLLCGKKKIAYLMEINFMWLSLQMCESGLTWSLHQGLKFFQIAPSIGLR